MKMEDLYGEYLFNNVSKDDYEEWYQYKSKDFNDLIKYIIINELDEVDRRVLLIYADYGNMRAVAAQMNVALGTVYKRINKIRNKIKRCL